MVQPPASVEKIHHRVSQLPGVNLYESKSNQENPAENSLTGRLSMLDMTDIHEAFW